MVTVYEGKVLLANEQGGVELQAGEKATARSGSAPAKSGDERGDARSSSSLDLVRENQQLRDELAAMRARPNSPGETSEQKQMRSWYDDEERDPIWAPKQESTVRARLERFLKIHAEDAAIDCRHRCCMVTMEEDAFDEISLEIQSDVGLGHMSEEWRLAPYPPAAEYPEFVNATFCFERDSPPVATPDRGVEREALLATAAAALQQCASSLEVPLRAVIELYVEKDGSIGDLKTEFVPSGIPASACIDDAIVGAASFAPSAKTSRVPVIVKLNPAAD
jgi:hypothetical protein